jgi:hypothetical protein
MRIDFTIILIFILASTQAQTNKDNFDSSGKKIEFKNQGEQETIGPEIFLQKIIQKRLLGSIVVKSLLAATPSNI